MNNMVHKTYLDYVNVFDINLDLDELKPTCLNIGEFIENQYAENMGNYINSGELDAPHTTKVFNQYNLLSFVSPKIYDVYKNIQNAFNQLPKKEDDFYIQCWLNVFKSNTELSWHHHWGKEYDCWHGFICVDAEPSITSYRIPDENGFSEIDIHNKNNTLVISKSDGDLHKTSVWNDPNRSRITIAFDILPMRTLIKTPNSKQINHWIPI